MAEVASFPLDSSLLVKIFKADLAAKCTHPDHLCSAFTCPDDAMPMLQQLFIILSTGFQVKMLITHSRLFYIDIVKFVVNHEVLVNFMNCIRGEASEGINRGLIE